MKRKSHTVTHSKHSKDVLPFIATHPRLTTHPSKSNKKRNALQNEMCRNFRFFNLCFYQKFRVYTTFTWLRTQRIQSTKISGSHGTEVIRYQIAEKWFQANKYVKVPPTKLRNVILRSAPVREVLMFLIFISGLFLDGVLKWLSQLFDAVTWNRTAQKVIRDTHTIE